MIIRRKICPEDKSVIYKYFICWTLLMLCFLTSSELFMAGFIAVSAVLLAVSSKDEALYLIFALVSLSSAVSLAPRYQTSLFGILIIIYIMRNLAGIRLHKRTALLYALLAIYMISGLRPGQSSLLSDIKTIVNYSLLLIFALAFEREQWIRLFDFYIWGHVCAALLAVIAGGSARLGQAIETDTAVVGEIEVRRFSGLDMDTNFFAVNCAFIIACLLFFLCSRGLKDISKKKIMTFTGIYFILGIMTFSKMFIVALGFAAFYYYMTNMQRKLARLILWSVLGISLFLMVNMYTNGAAVTLFFGRFTNPARDYGSVMNTLTTGRYVIWTAYVKDWLSDLGKILFGSGMAYKRLPEFKMHHQTYIEILYQFGIIGSVLFLSYIYSVFGMVRRNRMPRFTRPGNIRFIALFTAALCGLSLGLFAIDYTIPLLFLSFIMIAGGYTDMPDGEMPEKREESG